MTKKRNHRDRRGFSLPELTIVVLIIGILAAVALPHYAGSVSQFRAEAAAKRIAADLMYARQTALNQGVSKQVTFAISTNSYSMPGVPDPNSSALGYYVNLSSTAYPAKIVEADFDGSLVVTFDRFGQSNTQGTVTVKSDDHTKEVNLSDITGLATVQ